MSRSVIATTARFVAAVVFGGTGAAGEVPRGSQLHRSSITLDFSTVSVVVVPPEGGTQLGTTTNGVAMKRGRISRLASHRLGLFAGVLALMGGGWFAAVSHGAASYQAARHAQRGKLTFPSQAVLACPRNMLAFKRCESVHARAVTRHGRKPRALASASADRWLAYSTSVNPGGGIQFVSSSVGWRLDGVYASPWLDSNLTTGPAGTTLAWPASAVSESTDGGHTWSIVTSPSGGVWGLDFLSPSTGWVVGVTTLERTSDGGSSWQTLSEPSIGPLVSVRFATATDGFGLTTAGKLVSSTDGGQSWQAVPSLASAGSDLCFTTPENGYVADPQGNVLHTADGGATWSQDYLSDIPAAYDPVWSYLACDSTSVTQGIRVVSPWLQREGYLVVDRAAGASGWTAVASYDPAKTSTSTTAVNGLSSVEGVASAQGRPLVAGVPQLGFSPAVSSAAAPGDALASSASSVPQLPVGGGVDPLTSDPGFYLRVLGTSAVGNDRWLYVLDSAVQGTSPSYETLVLVSHDDGASWSVAANSGVLTQPQYQ